MNFFKKAGISQEESTKIILLIIQSFLIGGFLSYYFSVINGLFINTFSIKYLPHAYVTSGILGFLMTNIFIILQKKIKLSYLQTGLYIAIIIYMILYLIVFDNRTFIFQLDFIKSFHSLIIFIGFTLFFPIASLLAIGMGNMMLNFFDLKQGKQFFSIISSGEVISSAVAFFSISFIIEFFDKTSTIFYIPILCLFLTMLLQLYFNVRYKTLINRNYKEESDDKINSFVNIFKNKYYQSIIFLIFISTLVFYVVNYAFLTEVGINFESSNDIISFFGLFYSVFKLSEFVLKTFFSAKFFTYLGVKSGLSILPAFIFILTLLAILTLIFVKDLFFNMIILNMLFLLILKRSIEDSAIKLLFQPIDSSSKLILQSIGLGNISQLSIIFSGLFIYLISAVLDESSLLYILLAVLFFNLFWFFIISEVSKNLNNYIKQSLGKLSIKLPKKSVDSLIGIKTFITNELNFPQKIKSAISFNKINNFLTVPQYQQLYSDPSNYQKQFDNYYLEFSKNYQIFLHQKALLMGVSPHPNLSGFILNQLNITTSFETRLLIFKYLSKHKIELNADHLKSTSLIMNDVFDYYSCILSSILDLNYVDNHKKLIKLLEHELSVLEDIIFSYLEVIHSKNQIDLIRHSLKRGKLHENILALELLETLIYDEFKKVVLTIFDNLSIKSKVDNLSISFNHQRLKLNQRLNYILNSPAYWFNDLIRMEAIDLISNNYQIKNSALLSHIFNSNNAIKNLALYKIKQIDINKNFINHYLGHDNSKNLLIEFDSIKEQLSLDNLDENFKFQLFFSGTIVKDVNNEEIKKLNMDHYVCFILKGSLKLSSSKYVPGDIVNLFNTNVLDKKMFSMDTAYLRILHQKLIPFVMSNPNLANKLS